MAWQYLCAGDAVLVAYEYEATDFDCTFFRLQNSHYIHLRINRNATFVEFSVFSVGSVLFVNENSSRTVSVMLAAIVGAAGRFVQPLPSKYNHFQFILATLFYLYLCAHTATACSSEFTDPCEVVNNAANSVCGGKRVLYVNQHGRHTAGFRIHLILHGKFLVAHHRCRRSESNSRQSFRIFGTAFVNRLFDGRLWEMFGFILRPNIPKSVIKAIQFLAATCFTCLPMCTNPPFVWL